LKLISELDDKMTAKPSEWRVMVDLRLMLFAVMFTHIWPVSQTKLQTKMHV